MVSLKKKWVKTDDWRGYYQYDNAVHGGHMLNGYGDEVAETHNEAEKQKQDKIKRVLRENKIPFRLAYAQTSNVFSASYDIVVDKENVDKSKKLLKDVV